MDLPDVNVLVYAHREDVADHQKYRTWLEHLCNRQEAYGLADIVLSGFVRVITSRAIFPVPTSLPRALEAVEALRARANAVTVAPGPRHWALFTDVCRKADARGNLVSDAWLAALAIEHGCDLVTTDRDFSRFPGLKWRHPLR